ncbi:hypothetical protein KIN20_028279, partial [Parelaphostrongylus tenuis]
MWQSPLSTALAASQGQQQANSTLLQQITMLHNLHQQQMPSLNYLQVAVAPTNNHSVLKNQPLSELRLTPVLTTPPSSSNGSSSSHAHVSASYNITSKISSVSVSSPIVPLANTTTTTTSSPASKRPCISDSEDSAQASIQRKRSSPRSDTSPGCIQSQSS